ncbi:hypothetical protein AJ80_01978 [Polytolypa hystricis UAMH7299]|uniref:Uncharacterized protein n=1 Tax=Polytolypa hystricis (strain UAMH7299) TaxID=1447883 RepID=A0A2B7YQG8_POLH7|nr:hypothetical protein AJ80_01978 [Polytolypa hystricis UAMH7299]
MSTDLMCQVLRIPGRLSNKAALVTGGASGFGAAIAAKFILEGAEVVITGLSIENGQDVSNELKCSFVQADVTKRSDWEFVLNEVLREHGGIDIVVNNAGATYPSKTLWKGKERDFDLCINVNLKSLFLATSVIVPTTIKQNRGGCFVQVSSISAKRPGAGLTWYASSKAAVTTMRAASKSLAVEFGPSGMRFNSVSPGIGAT